MKISVRFASNLVHRGFVAAVLALPLGSVASAGLLQPDNTPLHQFGFATGPEVSTLAQFQEYFDVTNRVLSPHGIVRTSLGWDPTKHDTPDFKSWNERVLDPALRESITILPGIRTLNLTSGGYRMPTDAQWVHGLRQIVRMYGPGGIYARGGTYVRNGRAVYIAPHPGFPGLTDYELWNEPNSPTGSLGGAMTPARIVQLLRVGSAAMREEADRLGFRINIVGPAVDGMDLDYIVRMWEADNRLFEYVDTLSIHAYSRFSTLQCNVTNKRCIRRTQLIRDFLDSHGGEHVHLASTEGAIAGTQGTCRGPQVHTEEGQSDLNEEALEWIRANPGLDFDFWVTYHAIDGTRPYGYPCDSGVYDNAFWKSRLGVVREDLSMKPWGARYRQLAASWYPDDPPADDPPVDDPPVDDPPVDDPPDQTVGPVIDRTLGTHFGSHTGGARVAGIFNGLTSQIGGQSAQKNYSTMSYAGTDLASPSTIALAIVYGPNDIGYVSNDNRTTVTLQLRASDGAPPANDAQAMTQGVALGEVTFTDAADESAGREIASSDAVNEYDNVWVVMTTGSNKGHRMTEIEFRCWTEPAGAQAAARRP